MAPLRHCERSEAIHGAAKEESMDCLVAEFIIGPAEGRTRWLLAMTNTIHFSFCELDDSEGVTR